MFKGIDHIAIVVKDTSEVLPLWTNMFGLSVRHTEVVNNGTVKLTHLDGNGTDLQLVEPMTDDHPLCDWLEKNGSGLHHICFSADIDKPEIENLKKAGITPGEPSLHQGIMGKWALFLDKKSTGNILVELTGE